MKGRICLVTGCGSGIGEFVAIGLAKMGATIAGLGSTDLIFEIALAMAKGIGAREMAELIHPPLSFSEAIMNTLGKVEEEATFGFK
jgi:NAD(P)-dependent dehydrogenase (short-subunit alcohol dehydrogenase family)